MTYLQAIKDLNYESDKYRALSDAFFPSFLNVKNIKVKEAPIKEAQIKALLELLNERLFYTGLELPTKLALIDYISQLQLALEIIEIKKGNKNINDVKKAGYHLAKKMQSSFPELVKKNNSKSSTKQSSKLGTWSKRVTPKSPVTTYKSTGRNPSVRKNQPKIKELS